ncbi:MAG: GFA family protein, partial [Pseudomonadota bacterium]
MATARCLCGEVVFELKGSLRPVIYCHCDQCRRTSGHFVAATAVNPDEIEFIKDTGLRWYYSSDSAQRGFCERCGSSLLWKPSHGKHISVMAGCVDEPSGLQADEHIYVQNR